jgi:hypothetical protein
MEENLSKLPLFAADRKKLQEFQKQKGCDALTPPRKENRTSQSKTGEKGGAVEAKANSKETRRK